MAKIFISHASEDKSDFVRPLAEALKKSHDIWYDEYELNVGDSLRSKIDEGLRLCDFGVVVLSRSFFEKHWTQNELDALFALETAYRKIILPVWYKITKEEVAHHSPMLAGRLASIGNRGIEVVVSELLRAVSASERTKELAEPKQGKAKLLALSRGLGGKEHEDRLFRTVKGVELFNGAAIVLMNQIKSDIGEVNAAEGTPRFAVGKESGEEFLIIHGPYRVSLHLAKRDYYMNSISDAKLMVYHYARPDDYNPERRRNTLDEYEYRPRCREGEIIAWHAVGDTKVISTSELAQIVLVNFSKTIESNQPE